MLSRQRSSWARAVFLLFSALREQRDEETEIETDLKDGGLILSDLWANLENHTQQNHTTVLSSILLWTLTSSR